MANEMIYGLHAVQALLKRAPQRVQVIWVLEGRADARLQKVLQAAEKHKLPISSKSRKELDQACEGNNHQGVLVFASPGRVHDEKSLLDLVREVDGHPLLLVLDGVTDPHNLGACLRTADAAGVHAVIVPKDNSASLNDAARKVACGAAEAVPLITVTNLARTLRVLKDEGLWLVGTSGEAQVSIYEAPLTGPLVLVMGAEGSGMRRLTAETCDHLAYIPMAGSVSSLNVSVATGVCLFEAVRRRKGG